MLSWFELQIPMELCCLPGERAYPCPHPCCPAKRDKTRPPEPINALLSICRPTPPPTCRARRNAAASTTALLKPARPNHLQDDDSTEPQENPTKRPAKKSRKRGQTGQTTTAAVFCAQECQSQFLERDPFLVSRLCDPGTPFEAIPAPGTREGRRTPHYSSSCDPAAFGVSHLHQETQLDLDLVGATRARDVYWEALRLGLEGRRSGRKGLGRGRQDVEKLQWRCHRGRDQP